MKYLVAHMIPESSPIYRVAQMQADWYREKYNLPDPFSWIGPHITIKAPFECTGEEIIEVEEKLKKVLRGIEPFAISVQEVCHFPRWEVDEHGMPDFVSPGCLVLKVRGKDVFYEVLEEGLLTLPFVRYAPFESDHHNHITITKPLPEKFPIHPVGLNIRIEKLGSPVLGAILSISIMKKESGMSSWKEHRTYFI